MKTAELTGPLLDYWVAKAEGLHIDGMRPECVVGVTPNRFVYRPTGNWSQGGPIIERERIAIVCCRIYHQKNDGEYWDAYYDGRYNGPDGQVNGKGDVSEGPTPLIAAMRAYVASVYGDTVPDDPAA